jgi:hypothetical protein
MQLSGYARQCSQEGVHDTLAELQSLMEANGYSSELHSVCFKTLNLMATFKLPSCSDVCYSKP